MELEREGEGDVSGSRISPTYSTRGIGTYRQDGRLLLLRVPTPQINEMQRAQHRGHAGRP
jgi:hypothetical protein